VGPCHRGMDTEGSSEYIKLAVADSRKCVVLQLWG